MSNEIISLTAEEYQIETNMSFSTQDFKTISQEEACMLFEQEVPLLSFFPTILKYGETRDNPLTYQRSEEEVINNCRYVKYRLSNKLTTFDMAFKLKMQLTEEVIKLSSNRVLTPLFPAYFKKLLGYEMHVTDGHLHRVPKETLYALMYGAPDLTPYLHQSDLDVLKEFDIKEVYTMPLIIHDRMVIERFILTTPVKHIVIGGYREYAE